MWIFYHIRCCSSWTGNVFKKKKKTLIINIKRSPWSDGHEDFVRCWIQCLRSRVFATYDKKVSSLWVVVDEELPPPGFVRFYLLLYHHTFLCFYVSRIRDKIKWEIRFRSEKDLCFGYTFISKTGGSPLPQKKPFFHFSFSFFLLKILKGKNLRNYFILWICLSNKFWRNFQWSLNFGLCKL